MGMSTCGMEMRRQRSDVSTRRAMPECPGNLSLSIFRIILFAMAETIYVDIIAILLLLSALCHISFSSRTTYWMTKRGLVRFIGGCLVLLSLPSLLWRGWYFWTLFAALAVSGAWRLCFPRSSISAQERSYPRWVHGCLLLAGSIGVWVLRP